MRSWFNRKVGNKKHNLDAKQQPIIARHLEVMTRKLNYLREQYIILSDPSQKFTVKIQIEELEQELATGKLRGIAFGYDTFTINRERLVKRVLHRYKKYPFPKGSTYVPLDLQSSDADVQPLPMRMLERLDSEVQDTDVTNRSIRGVFAEQGNELLILGEPGAGKTTLLYELALELAEFAQQQSSEPVPIVLNLSSWSKNRTDIGEWIIQELQEYGVGRDFAKALIETFQITLLLDGLDEVAQQHRNACVEAINVFLQEQTLYTVVCCRRTEYDLIKKASFILKLNSAVVIKSILKEKVSAYLQKNNLSALQQIFLHELVLEGLLTTPLWLGVARQSFANTKFTLSDFTDTEKAKNQLWQAYIQQALLYKKTVEDGKYKRYYTDAQTLDWIKWLAGILKNRDLSIFYLEWMQPDLLPRKDYNKYIYISAFLSWGMIGIGMTWFFKFDLFFFLSAAVVSTKIATEFSNYNSIVLVEIKKWSWNDFFNINLPQSVIKGLGFGLLLLITSLFENPDDLFKISYIGKLLLNCTFLGIIYAIKISWNTHEIIENTLLPNEGVWRSLNFALKSSVLGAFPISILIMLGYEYIGLASLFAVDSIPSNSLSIGVYCFYFIWGFLFIETGGKVVIQHYVLQYLLYRSGTVPFRYIPFLEHCCRLGLLRRIGGGYTFYHRELRDYLGAQWQAEEKTKYETSASEAN